MAFVPCIGQDKGTLIAHTVQAQKSMPRVLCTASIYWGEQCTPFFHSFLPSSPLIGPRWPDDVTVDLPLGKSTCQPSPTMQSHPKDQLLRLRMSSAASPMPHMGPVTPKCPQRNLQLRHQNAKHLRKTQRMNGQHPENLGVRYGIASVTKIYVEHSVQRLKQVAVTGDVQSPKPGTETSALSEVTQSVVRGTVTDMEYIRPPKGQHAPNR